MVSDERSMNPLWNLFRALLAPLLLAATMVGGTIWSEGLSMGQRVMTDLAMPVGLAWLGALAATCYQWGQGRRAAAAGFAALFVAVTVLFNPLVANLGFALTEMPPRIPAPTSQQAPRYDTLVVLGGGARRNAAGQPELGEAGERLALAAKMWHAGKTDAIICTGAWKTRAVAESPAAAATAGEFAAEDPAEIGREILVALGVPAEHIFRSPGENTSAEMRHLAALLADPPPELAGPTIGLITSGYHLPRAMRLAKTRGLDFVPLPADTRSPAGRRGLGSVVPTVSAGDSIAQIAKEWLAWLIGR